MASEDYVIRVEKLSKCYVDDKSDLTCAVNAVKNISFFVKRGERIAIMGKSGSGKSTLLHILGCLDIPTSGKLFIDGEDASSMAPQELADLRRDKIGFVFQQFHLIPTLTATQNVALPLMLKGIPTAEREKKAIETLESLGLGHRLTHLPSKLSGGERQRVAIARSLINEPPVILADEPTGNLDSKAGDEVMAIFERLHKKEKKTIVVVTHDPDVSEHSERIIHMKDGEIESIDILKKR
jgi:putative ABC transport system ATP-binding protein